MALYYLFITTIFIFIMVIASRTVVCIENEDNSEFVRKYVFLSGCSIVSGSLCILAAFLPEGILRNVIFFFSHFAKYMGLIVVLEIIAFLSDLNENEKNKRNALIISSTLSQVGVFVFFIDILTGGDRLVRSKFGIFFDLNIPWLNLIHVIYFIVIVCIIIYYSLKYRKNCRKKRDIHAFLLCLFAALIMGAALIAESLTTLFLRKYVPFILIAVFACNIFFEICYKYKVSTIYRYDRFKEELEPSNNKTVFICNDENEIIYLNKRGEIIEKAYKVSFVGKKLSDALVFSEEEKKKIEDLSEKEVDIKGLYVQKDDRVSLHIERRFDNFSELFASIVTITGSNNSDGVEAEAANEKASNKTVVAYKDASDNVEEKSGEEVKETALNIAVSDGNDTLDNASNETDSSEKPEEDKKEIINEEINNLKLDSLYEYMEKTEKYYKTKEKILFESCLKMVRKLSDNLSFTSLNEICENMEEEFLFGDFEDIESLMTDFSGQLQAIKNVR